MRNRLFSKIFIYFRLIRISNWIKNLFVLVPWLFAKQLFEQESTTRIIIAFFSFCFISSFVYVLNDKFDIENDRNHPIKKIQAYCFGGSVFCFRLHYDGAVIDFSIRICIFTKCKVYYYLNSVRSSELFLFINT